MVLPGFTTPEESGLSALVRDYNGAVVGCITTSAPKTRVPESMIDELVAGVVAAAAVSARWVSGPGAPGEGRLTGTKRQRTTAGSPAVVLLR